MEIAGTVFTGLSMASIITMSGLTINLTENFGNLALDESIKQETTGPRLVGAYGNAVTGMSSVVIGLSLMYIGFFAYGMYRRRYRKTPNIQKVYWVVMMLAIAMGIVSASINLNLTENYQNIDNLSTDPNPVIPGENYRLRGVYGTATLGLNIASLALSFVAFVWMTGLFFHRLRKNTILKASFDEDDYKLHNMRYSMNWKVI